MSDAFPELFEALREACLTCRDRPTTTVVFGPNDLRLQSYGHAFDAQEWVGDQQ